MYHSNKGFTLVEVMISAVIVFSALSVGMIAYRTSLIAMDRISANVLIADALPAIMATVKTQIAEHKSQGKGHYGNTIVYIWNAKEIKSSKNILGFPNEVTGGLAYGRFQIVFSNVELTVTYEGEGRRKEASYEYHELSWSG